MNRLLSFIARFWDFASIIIEIAVFFFSTKPRKGMKLVEF